MDEIKVRGYSITIYFSNDTNVVISRQTTDTSEVVNYVKSLTVRESMYTANQNPIGVINSGTFKITFHSSDRSLVPENVVSPYYGLMDTTAEVEISILTDDAANNNIVTFGRYFVSNWTSNASSDNKYQVVIEGTDLLGILLKNEVPPVEIKKDILVTDILADLRTKIIASISNKYGFTWKYINNPKYNMLLNNDIEANNLSILLNTIGQSTLINMFISRQSEANNKEISIIDATQPIGIPSVSLSDTKEITKASLDRGALVGYTGVKVNYSTYNVNNASQITNLSSIALAPGSNTIESIDIGGKVFKINTIEVRTDSETPIEITSLTYNKRTATIVLNNPTDVNVNVNILITGQTLNENNLSVTKLSSINSNEILELTNGLVTMNNIDSYANDVLSLIGTRGESIKVSGMFNPVYMKLNTPVTIDCSRSIYVQGDYRVVELNWTLGSTLKCEAKLTK